MDFEEGAPTTKRLRFERRARCAFSEAVPYVREFFDEHVAGLLSVPVSFGPIHAKFKRAVEMAVSVGPDRTDYARRHDAIDLAIHPLGPLPFPEIRCFVTLRPFMPPGTLVVLDFAYEPPLGSLGRLLDALAGRHVARAIGLALEHDLCAFVEARDLADQRERCAR
jgi:hypothetical protein